MDATEALTLPGVKAYVNADDVPGDNKTGYHVLDEEVFATDKVRIIKSIYSGRPRHRIYWTGKHNGFDG